MSSNPYDYCKYCEVKLPKVKVKRYRATMCRDCHMDKVDGNHELTKIFNQLRKNQTNTEEEDWGAENVEDKDNVPLRNKRKGTYVFSRNIIDEI